MAVLRQAREEIGISQRQLSTKLKRPKNYASLVETGQRMLDISEFMVYVNAMGADPVELFTEIARRSAKKR